MEKRREPSSLHLVLQFGRMHKQAERGRGRAQGRREGRAEAVLQGGWELPSVPVAYAEWFSPKPVGRRTISGAKYISIGIFSGFSVRRLP